MKTNTTFNAARRLMAGASLSEAMTLRARQPGFSRREFELEWFPSPAMFRFSTRAHCPAEDRRFRGFRQVCEQPIRIERVWLSSEPDGEPVLRVAKSFSRSCMVHSFSSRDLKQRFHILRGASGGWLMGA